MLRIYPFTLLTVFCLLGGLSVNGQEIDKRYSVDCLDDPHCGYVIALSGLKLRAAPDFQAKTLVTIPFGSKVSRPAPLITTQDRSEEQPDLFFTPDSIGGY